MIRRETVDFLKRLKWFKTQEAPLPECWWKSRRRRAESSVNVMHVDKDVRGNRKQSERLCSVLWQPLWQQDGSHDPPCQRAFRTRWTSERQRARRIQTLHLNICWRLTANLLPVLWLVDFLSGFSGSCVQREAAVSEGCLQSAWTPQTFHLLFTARSWSEPILGLFTAWLMVPGSKNWPTDDNSTGPERGMSSCWLQPKMGAEPTGLKTRPLTVSENRTE